MADYYQSALFAPTAPRERLESKNKSKVTNKKETNNVKKNLRGECHYASETREKNEIFRTFQNSSNIHEENNIENSNESNPVNYEAKGRDKSSVSKQNILEQNPNYQKYSGTEKTNEEQHSKNHFPNYGSKKCVMRLGSLKNLLISVRSKPENSDTERLNNRSKESNPKKQSLSLLVKKTKKSAKNLYDCSSKTLEVRKKKARKSFGKGCRRMGIGVLNMTSTMPEYYPTHRVLSQQSYEKTYLYDPTCKFLY